MLRRSNTMGEQVMRATSPGPLVSACVAVTGVSLTLWTVGPLLPSFSGSMHSRQFAGVVLAGHPIGSLTAALPTWYASRRFGLPRVILTGGGLSLLASALFVWPAGGWWIVLARIGLGASATMIWQSVFAWTVTYAGAARRARSYGIMLAASTFGMMLAPQIGALAERYGLWLCATPSLVVATVAIRLAFMAPYEMQLRSDTHVRRVLASSKAVVGIGLASAGAVIALGVGISLPLALHTHGLGATSIAAVLTAAYSAVIVFYPVVGRFVDRGGARVILVSGFSGLAAALTALALAPSVTAALISATMCSALTGIPGFVGGVLLSRGIAEIGVDQTVAQTVNTLAWAPAGILGSILGSSIGDPERTLLALGATTACAAIVATAGLVLRVDRGRRSFRSATTTLRRYPAHSRESATGDPRRSELG